MNKKGFAITFTWLFNIMAGIIILLSLVYFSVQHTDLFGKVSAQRAVEELDIAFTSFKSNLVGTTIELGKNIKLKVECDINYGEKIYINEIAGKTLKGKIVFAPSTEMNSNQFSIWTADWNVPFKITNFIFLAEKGKSYNLVDSPLGFKEKIPEDLFDLDSVNGDRIEFVEGTNFVDCLNVNDIKIYWEKDTKLDDYYGTICANGGFYNFVGEAMMYAAVFADENNFGCLHRKAMDKVGTLSKFYNQKLINLNCEPTRLGRNRMEILGLRNLIEQDGGIDLAKRIKLENDDLLRRGPCEGIY